MIAYIYNTDTLNVHAVIKGSKADYVSSQLADGEEYAVTLSPAFGSNGGVVMMQGTNIYDTDAADFDVYNCSL